MTQALDQSIAELLHASRDDETILGLGAAVVDRIFGFHAQQAVEKLLKALIGAHGQRFEHTHDLGLLMRHAEALGEYFEIKDALLKSLSAYAGIWRYQDPEFFSVAERDELSSLVAQIKVQTLNRLFTLRPGVDWNAI